MGDVKVPRGARVKLGLVEGNLDLERDSQVETEGASSIRVSGGVRCRGDAEFRGSVECADFRADEGRISVSGDLKSGGEVEIRNGELTVEGSLEARSVDVDRRLTISKDAKAEDFDVGGALEVLGSISARSVDAGGSFKVGGAATVDSIDVGGSVDIQGALKGAKVDVGGAVSLAGGEVSDQVDVGGSFTSSKPLKFNRIDVGGSVMLAEGGHGGRVDVGGRFESRGSLTFDTIEVGGTVEIGGDGDGVSIDVGGTFQTSGNLTLKEDLRVGGRARIGKALRLNSLDVGGEIEADLVEAKDEVEVGGRLRSNKGTKANRIELGAHSRASGPLIAEKVRIREGGEVEDVYSGELELERRVRARSLYVRVARLESQCRISGEVLYQDRLEAEPDVEYAKPPVKTAELPKPPL